MIRLAILLAAVFFQQGTSPIPRPPQPSVTKQQSPEPNKQKAETEQNATKPNAPIGNAQPATNSSNQNAQTIEPRNNESAVRIISLPPVTTTRDTPTFVVSVVLAVIGIAGIAIGICTLVILKRQTKAIRRSAIAAVSNAFAAKEGAKAAKANTAALIASERPWIGAEVIQHKIIGVTRYSLNITNHGKTPAQIIDYDIWHGPLTGDGPFSKDRLSTHYKANDGLLLASGDTRTLIKDFDMDDFFQPVEGAQPPQTSPVDVDSGAFCVTIRYEDLVTQGQDRRSHQTSFVYYYTPMFETLDRIPEYNEYT